MDPGNLAVDDFAWRMAELRRRGLRSIHGAAYTRPSVTTEAMNSWLEAGLSLLYPACCQLCGSERATAAEGFVCGQCQSRPQGVRFVTPPFCDRCGLPYDGAITTRFECGNCREMDLRFSQAKAAVVATDLILDVIHRYKYNRALWFEPFLASLLVRQASPDLASGGWDLIVPVPLHPMKQREREFNQADRLARNLGLASGLRVTDSLIRRTRPTRTQTRLGRTERADNVAGSFAPSPGAQLKGERVVVIDDVLTTGATTSACAEVLRQIGAGDVCVWTVARGL